MDLWSQGILTEEEIRRHPAYKKGWDLYLAHVNRGKIWPSSIPLRDRRNPYSNQPDRNIWAMAAYSALGDSFCGWAKNCPPLEEIFVPQQLNLFD